MHSEVTFTAFRKSYIGKILGKINRKKWKIYKKIYWSICKNYKEKITVFVLGCQRSGTSLLCDVFDNDIMTFVLQEDSCITGRNGFRLRLKSYGEVNKVISSINSPIIITKPLVESHNALELLGNIPRSRAIWIFRNYKDVIKSDVNRFKNQIMNLGKILKEESKDWRCERISNETRSILVDSFSEDMSRYDAAALFWYTRNVLFFELQLDSNPNVSMCKYEDFVANPSDVIQKIYRFLGLEYPRRNIVKEVDVKSLGLGCTIELRSEIDRLCNDLQNRLEECYERLNNPNKPVMQMEGSTALNRD